MPHRVANDTTLVRVKCRFPIANDHLLNECPFTQHRRLGLHLMDDELKRTHHTCHRSKFLPKSMFLLICLSPLLLPIYYRQGHRSHLRGSYHLFAHHFFTPTRSLPDLRRHFWDLVAGPLTQCTHPHISSKIQYFRRRSHNSGCDRGVPPLPHYAPVIYFFPHSSPSVASMSSRHPS